MHDSWVDDDWMMIWSQGAESSLLQNGWMGEATWTLPPLPCSCQCRGSPSTTSPRSHTPQWNTKNHAWDQTWSWNLTETTSQWSKLHISSHQLAKAPSERSKWETQLKLFDASLCSTSTCQSMVKSSTEWQVKTKIVHKWQPQQRLNTNCKNPWTLQALHAWQPWRDGTALLSCIPSPTRVRKPWQLKLSAISCRDHVHPKCDFKPSDFLHHIFTSAISTGSVTSILVPQIWGEDNLRKNWMC